MGVVRLDSIGPRALNPNLTIVVCGPIGAATPAGEKLGDQVGRTFLNQRLYMLGQHSLAVDVIEGRKSHLHQPLLGKASRPSKEPLLTTPIPRPFSSTTHLSAKSTPEQVRRLWKPQPTSAN
jgi:hypothetical protein